MQKDETVSGSEQHPKQFSAPVCDLIKGTIERMRRLAIGYPTLDNRIDEDMGFVTPLMSQLVDEKVVKENSAADDVAAGYLEGMMTPKAFCGPSSRDRHATALTFWAFVRAIQDLSTTSGQYGLNEVARNTGFFGHLSSTLRTFLDLEGMIDADSLIYWADFASEHLEPEIGADFAIVHSLGNGRYKVAFLQAKRVQNDPNAYIGHYVKGKNQHQINILADHEIFHLDKSSSNCGKPNENDLTIFGRWCFYVFWHEVGESGDLLLPTVRSAHSVRKTRESWTSSSLTAGVEFAAFVTLFLADPASSVGYLVDVEAMPALFKGHRPSSLLFLDSPTNGLVPKAKVALLNKIGYAPASPGSRMVREIPQLEAKSFGL
ncbi:hypothetical protein [Methylobacterium bullatum]|uniref:Uncharacterized protein n=1 Tax=Methylobacterium bullatum TaxID=570505 RepID=A0A679KHM1_9HYPH|nr:hypothetical protein MBLL_04261 [Methylobacterium bullatum]